MPASGVYGLVVTTVLGVVGALVGGVYWGTDSESLARSDGTFDLRSIADCRRWQYRPIAWLSSSRQAVTLLGLV